MRRYIVQFECTSYYDVSVEANSIEEAIEKAKEVEVSKNDMDIEDIVPVLAETEGDKNKERWSI